MKQAAAPQYFSSGSGMLFGWIHQADELRHTGLGVVLCNPLGNEAICTHRTYRRLSELAASMGIPALRFDYRGTGDSCGTPDDPDQLASWVQDTRSAIDLLKRRTGVRRVCLFGVRLGAMIAMLAARDQPDVSGIVTIAAVTTGRRYMREMRALAAAASTPASVQRRTDDSLEVAGFRMSSQTQKDIAQADLPPVQNLSLRAALILHRDDMPDSGDLSLTLAAGGVNVSQAACTGYANMMLDPHDSIVPSAALGRIVHWLVEQGRVETEPREASTTSGCGTAFAATFEGVTEQAVYLDDDRQVFAIVTIPERRSLSESGGHGKNRVLLLLNSGSVHHVGPHRLYVDLARSLARGQQLITIRLDLVGLGDSAWMPVTDDNSPYPSSAVANIARAAAYVREKLGADEVHAAGICSGAYHSLKAAAKHLRLNSVIVVNPLTFFWRPGMSLAQPEHHVAAEAVRYLESFGRIDSWAKLIRGDVDMLAAASIVQRRFRLRLRHAFREIARTLHIPLREDLARELHGIAQDGTKLHFVFASSDPGLGMLIEQGGRMVTRLKERDVLEIAIIEGADHTFTQSWAREILGKQLQDRLAASR